jgi:hypothetical protein
MNRIDQLTRVLSDNASFVTQRSPALELLRERGFTAPRDTSLCESMFGPVSRDTGLCESVFGIHKRAFGDLRRCVLCFLSPYLEILIPLSPRYEGKTGPASVPPLTSVARLMCAHADEINGPPLEPAPQKQLKGQKKHSKHPWSRPKRGVAGHPTSVAQIGVGGLWALRSTPLHVCDREEHHR